MNILFYLSFFLLQPPAAAEWKTYKSTPEVDVLYRTEECHDEANGFHREYILLKFVNKTDRSLHLTWQLERYENNACVTCNQDEYKYSMYMGAGETLVGECTSGGTPGLKIFTKHLNLPNHSTFTKFELGAFTAVAATHVSPKF